MGLFDRDYMRGPENGYGPRRGMETDDWRSTFWSLIGINVFTFLVLTMSHSPFYYQLALWGNAPAFNQLYALVTAAFLHASWTHLFFNMYGLYLFGSLVGPHVGGKKFLLLYLISGVVGNLFFLLCNYGQGICIVGASGAVFGMMSAAACLEPNRKFMMLFLPGLPLKTVTLVVGYAVLEIFLQLTGNEAGISHLAHLGGFAGGYLYLKLLFRNDLPWDPLRRNFRPGTYEVPPDTAPHHRRPAGPVTGAELDALLDKVSRLGINGLSEYELNRLRQAREQMRGK